MRTEELTAIRELEQRNKITGIFNTSEGLLLYLYSNLFRGRARLRRNIYVLFLSAMQRKLLYALHRDRQLASVVAGGPFPGRI